MVINRAAAIVATLLLLCAAPGFGDSGATWCQIHWSDGIKDHHAWFYLKGGSCENFTTTEVTQLFRRPAPDSRAQHFSGGLVLRLSRELDGAELQEWFASRGIDEYYRARGRRPVYVVNTPADISTLKIVEELIKDPAVKTASPNWKQPLVAK